MKIQVLGSGCAKCKKLMDNVVECVNSEQLDCDIEKVSDLNKIVAMGVMITPALAIDGKVVSSGKLLSVDEIRSLI